MLGARLVREDPGGVIRIGRIVEVEAYGGPGDRASHARAGLTPRTAVMFGPAGMAYVYLVYGMYDCLNVVTGRDGEAGAVLLRAVEPITGQEAMRIGRAAIAERRRGRSGPAGARQIANPADPRLASGPGRLCAAFGVDRTFTGLDLCATRSRLRLEPPAATDRHPDPAWTPRIGVGHAGEPWASIPWRLVDRGSPALSGLGR